MKKSKKAAMAIVQELVDRREIGETHLKRVDIAQKKFIESLRKLKWVLETAVPHFPQPEFQAALRDVETYKECLINLSEAQAQLAEDYVSEIELYKKLIDTIPNDLWK